MNGAKRALAMSLRQCDAATEGVGAAPGRRDATVLTIWF